MADFSFKISPNIILGSYTTSRLGEFALEYGKRFMLVLDPILKESGLAEKISESLSNRQIDFFTFEGVTEGSNTKTIQQALELAKKSHVNGVIAAGGGKALNVARAVCAVYNETKDFYDFVDGNALSAEPLPLICLPTTIRDSFLFTDYVPLTDSRSSQTKILKCQNKLCKLIMFDPNLTVSLTNNQIDSMSLETLCIATEAYLSQKSNFFSDMLAEKAISILGIASDESEEPSITTPREELLSQGGCMASLAAGASAIGTPSLLAMCINARFKISRALTTTILFPHFVEDCSKFKVAKIAFIAKILHLSKEGDTDEQAAQAYVDYIRQRIAKANLPARLKDLSITIDQLALAAEDAGKLEFINTLPRSMTSDDLFGLAKAAF